MFIFLALSVDRLRQRPRGFGNSSANDTGVIHRNTGHSSDHEDLANTGEEKGCESDNPAVGPAPGI